MKKITKQDNNREQNRRYRTLVKNDFKILSSAVKNTEKNLFSDDLKKILSTAQKHLDKSVSRGIIHENNASRKKRLLFKIFNSFSRS